MFTYEEKNDRILNKSIMIIQNCTFPAAYNAMYKYTQKKKKIEILRWIWESAHGIIRMTT